MNPITQTAHNLEREAQALYAALRQHRSLHARQSLSDAAWKRYERRVHLTNTIRQLEHQAVPTKIQSFGQELPCEACDGEGGWDDSFYWETGDGRGIHGGPIDCDVCGGSGWRDLEDPAADALDYWLDVPLEPIAVNFREAA